MEVFFLIFLSFKIIRNNFISVHLETLSNGQNVTLRAGVGLLSRNIKIVGANLDEGIGARVLVGVFKDKDKTYSGQYH